jgi:hypothetical protein
MGPGSVAGFRSSALDLDEGARDKGRSYLPHPSSFYG